VSGREPETAEQDDRVVVESRGEARRFGESVRTPSRGYDSAMNVNRILLIAAIVLFLLVALSAFSADINLNETGWLALGLAAYGASHLSFATVGTGRPRRRLVRDL
jgi:hypothetical protein